MFKKQNILAALLSIGMSVGYAMFTHFLFLRGNQGDTFQIMSIGFLFASPMVIGAISVFFSNIEQVRNPGYRVLFPWISIFVFFCITMFFSLEGWACWLMAMPLFLIAATVGGLLGGLLKMREFDNKLFFSPLILLPFLIAPIEQNLIGAQGTVYTADTQIDIEAPAAEIWKNVVAVQTIEAEQDKGWLTRNLGFPRPVKAELDFAGVGGKREAIFTNGLVFHETVSEYVDQKKMVFAIKANPYEIPSTTMDEHVVIGGEYFDVIDGTYELEQIDAHTQRLHLYSHFKLTTTFNFYASLWARWIMQDIQNNILQIQKQRAEGK